jgi:hypothetical protein
MFVSTAVDILDYSADGEVMWKALLGGSGGDEAGTTTTPDEAEHERAAAAAAAVAPSAAIVSKTSVMYQGSRSATNISYAGFMCPGLVALKGHLLTFAEGRLWDCADFGHHDLVSRRSVDDGKTWEPLRTLFDPNTLPGCNKTEACLPYSTACQTGKGKICGGGCAVWDPTPVVDKVTGESECHWVQRLSVLPPPCSASNRALSSAVHVFFGRSTTSCRGGTRSPGARDDLWVMTSSDVGGTWSAPRNVTAEW